MKKIVFSRQTASARWLWILTILLALATACGGGGEGIDVSLSTANIKSATLASDSAGTNKTTTFDPEDTFYLIVDLANAPDDTNVKAEWIAVNVAAAEPNTPVANADLTQGSGTLTFDATNSGPWPAGDYKVNLYLNGELDRSLDFKVAGEVAAAPTAEPTAEPTPTSGALSGIDNIRNAVIQIQAEGSFVDPEFGQQTNAAGRGSGFIIDESGLAVTNNHVVTGAALVKVFLNGETTPRNARIVGVSECSDLAVIDIDGDGYDYLDWYDGDVNVGLEVYVAGFPLGDPEYTLTRGIVSKAHANGETPWASVDAVLEYDATTNPGNSGGPVLTADGKVLAVHYAGYSDARQAFGISSKIARGVVEQLKQGNDVDSIGINGEAIITADDIPGIWVSSVKSGSAADKAGVRGGDIITRMEGLVLATDGSMADYCDILRTRNADDVMSIEVLRYATQELLEGQLNGRVLETSLSFAEQVQEEVSTDPSASGTTYDNYVEITDDSGAIRVSVPSAWTEVDGGPWTNSDGETVGIALQAAANLDAFTNTWSEPGMAIRASSGLDMTVDEAHEFFDFSESCTFSGRNDYDDGLYKGSYEVWEGCGETGSTLVSLVAMPESQDILVLVQVQAVSQADFDALDQIFSTFIVENQ